jgi:hypothetical protein
MTVCRLATTYSRARIATVSGSTTKDSGARRTVGKMICPKIATIQGGSWMIAVSAKDCRWNAVYRAIGAMVCRRTG